MGNAHSSGDKGKGHGPPLVVTNAGHHHHSSWQGSNHITTTTTTTTTTGHGGGGGSGSGTYAPPTLSRIPRKEPPSLSPTSPAAGPSTMAVKDEVDSEVSSSNSDEVHTWTIDIARVVSPHTGPFVMLSSQGNLGREAILLMTSPSISTFYRGSLPPYRPSELFSYFLHLRPVKAILLRIETHDLRLVLCGRHYIGHLCIVHSDSTISHSTRNRSLCHHWN